MANKESKELTREQFSILKAKLESERDRLIFKDAIPAEELNLKKEEII